MMRLWPSGDELEMKVNARQKEDSPKRMDKASPESLAIIPRFIPRQQLLK